MWSIIDMNKRKSIILVVEDNGDSSVGNYSKKDETRQDPHL